MKPDIEIAQKAKLLHIEEIRDRLGIQDEEFHPFGHFKGKITLAALERFKAKPDGKLILVTAITPTKLGEGKTTTSIGLSLGINKLGKRSIVTLRQPSLGPVFGMKGGGAGGGYSQVLPMEDINLHFTGDIHAVTTAHNLLSAIINNQLHFLGGACQDVRKIVWPRALDMNDRSLRNIVVGLGGRENGYPREDGFIISAASEIMAILTLSQEIDDLKRRCCNILVGFSTDDRPIYASQYNICGALATILKDAIHPNLVQTIENTPALIHGGPFANISFGTNSIIATRLALKLSDYVVTECGFGSDLGFEKYVNLVSRAAGYAIHAVVIVATVRALKHQGGGHDLKALREGLSNLGKHIANVQEHGFSPIVAINRFPEDQKEEIELIQDYCRQLGVSAVSSEAHARGGAGAMALAEIVTRQADSANGLFQRTYEPEQTIEEKINRVATRIYGAEGVIYSWEAKSQMKLIESLGLGKLPICIAKTPLSFSDNKKKLNVPRGWRLNINDFRLAAGAGYLIPIAGDIMLMPGLPKNPSAEQIDIDSEGKRIVGLF